MINSLKEMLELSFMQRAFIAGLLVSLCASLIGASLVLRKKSMIGDGLSHVGFGAFAIASILNFAPLEFALPIVVIVSFFILKLNENNKINGDAAIALISSSSLAIGTFIVSLFGVNTDINNYLFGSILAISKSEVIISIALSIVVILLYLFSYNKIFALTFDEKFAKSIGIKTNLYNIIFASLCSIVIVLGMRLMGALLISSLVIFPTLSSMQVFKTFKNVVVSSVIISILAFIIGLVISYLLSTPTGATIVLVNLVIFLLFKFLAIVLKK